MTRNTNRGTYRKVIGLESSNLDQRLGILLRLLLLDALPLLLNSFPLPRSLVLLLPLNLLLPLLPRNLCRLDTLLLLLANRQLAVKLPTLRNEGATNSQRLTLRLDSLDKRAKLRILVLCWLVLSTVEDRNGVMQSLGNAAQTCPDKLRDRRLNSAVWPVGRTLIDSKAVVDELDASRKVVDTDVQLSAAGTTHHVRLNLLWVECAQRLRKLEQAGHLHRRVDLR